MGVRRKEDETMRWKEFTMPTRAEFETESLTPTYGRFVMEPFERGYALTCGNALRRALLSSVEGAAPIAVKIEGVQHEFSTLPGVLEDVMDILLNLRQVRFRVHGAPPKTLRLSASGERKVTARDFEPNHEVEILNPDLHLATLTDKVAVLHLEVELDVGRGFVPSERNKRPDMPVGVIPLDANFSPVTRVRYDVENTRVGQITDFERLVLEVWTDGRVGPEQAIHEAASLLREHFALLVKDAGGAVAVGPAKEGERLKELVHKGIEELDLSVRAQNALHNEGIKTIGDLVAKTDDDLLKFRNFGRKSLEEIKAALAAVGLSLGMDVSAYQPSSAGAEAVATAESPSGAPSGDA
jgi:DNA-directed RNA polymerase subunit alpha